MSRTPNILIVEDDTAMRQSCAKLFRLQGYGVTEAPSGAEALNQARQRGDIDIVLTDLKMPEMDGLTLLKEIKQLDPDIQVVLMTGYGSVKNAVEAMKHGAADYITKPFDTNELLATIGKIIQLGGLREEVSRLRSELREKYRFENIVGASAPMQLVYESIEAAKNTGSTVLICGESGTGKEIVAKAIHYSGMLAKKPFVPVNCAAIPRDIFESELFGHKKGAFTGAFRDSIGLFRAAHGGTIFLDEILEMPHETQPKLLRALQERRIRPIGAAEEILVNVRVIASTNQDAEEAMRNNRFRKDLYYRLSVITIELPPLRERLEDVPALAQHFIAKFNKVFERTLKDIDTHAMDVLSHYHWPGNVRELESAIENAFVLSKSDIIKKSDLPASIGEWADAHKLNPQHEKGAVTTLHEAERGLLLRALDASKGNKTRAALLLGISRPRLYKMIQRHQVKELHRSD